MKQLLIYICIISSLYTLKAQEVEADTLRTYTYGLRIGADLSKPLNSFLEENNKGFEIMGDFRFKPNLYAAVELGYHEKNTREDYLDFDTKGSYIKVGVNFNAYENWKGMENEIFIGFRYNLSFFSQTLNSYTPNVKGTYFIPTEVVPGTEYTDLNAHWLSIILGMKVETLNNLYLGFSLSVHKMIKTKEPENFSNLFVPGFNRVFSNNVGAGFNYSISYLIPILKKKQ